MPKKNDKFKQNDKKIDKAIKIARLFQKRAYAPYSQFFVGAAIIMENEKIYGGCNIENASYGATVCAERVALWKALTINKRFWKELIVISPTGGYPCGMCLQVLSEFALPQARVWIGDQKKITIELVLKELLPYAFGACQLKK